MITDAHPGMIIEREGRLARYFSAGPFKITDIVRANFDGRRLYCYMAVEGTNFPYKANFNRDGHLEGWREVEL